MAISTRTDTDPLLNQIDLILEKAVACGLSATHPVVIIRRDNWASIYVGYGAPDPANVAHLPTNLIRVEADPDSPSFKKGFSRHPSVATLWYPLRTVTQLSARQNNIYDELALNPLSRDGGKMNGKLLPRKIDESIETYDDDEVVPLSVIRKMIGSGGGGGSADHELRIQILEQHLTELDGKINALDFTFNFNQPEARSTWTITHNFGAFPSMVQCFKITGDQMIPEAIIRSPEDVNVLLIKWSEPTKGQATLIR